MSGTGFNPFWHPYLHSFLFKEPFPLLVCTLLHNQLLDALVSITLHDFVTNLEKYTWSYNVVVFVEKG